MKQFLAIAGLALAVVFSSCNTAPTPPASTTVSLGSGALADSLVGGALASKPGFSLYKFAKDTQGGTTSACNAACATSWPPLTVSSAAAFVAPSGATKAFATITRSDSTIQVTYDGWPLYFYSGDSSAGSSNGAAVANWSLAGK